MSARKADGDLPNGSGDAIRARSDEPRIDAERGAELDAALDACFNAMNGPDFRERLLAAAGFVRDWPEYAEWLRECGDTRAHELADRVYDAARDLLIAGAVWLDWNVPGFTLVLDTARRDAWRPRPAGEPALSCRMAAALVTDIAARAAAVDRLASERRGAGEATSAGETDDVLKLWNQLGDRQRDCLRVLAERKAIDADSRMTAAQLARAVLGKGGLPEALKEPLADLAARGLVESKSGRGGGYWLSDRGRALLAAADGDPGAGEATARPAAG